MLASYPRLTSSSLTDEFIRQRGTFVNFTHLVCPRWLSIATPSWTSFAPGLLPLHDVTTLQVSASRLKANHDVDGIVQGVWPPVAGERA